MDPGAKRFMWRVVGGITGDRKKSCVILTTHSMEEAEALSTKMGILVRGGVFTCFGTAQHIKDKFGTAFEIEIKMQKMDDHEMEKQLQMLNIAPEDEKPVQNFIRQAVSKNVLSQDMVSDFELCVLKMVYNLNASQHTIDDLSLSTELFITCLNSYLT